MRIVPGRDQRCGIRSKDRAAYAVQLLREIRAHDPARAQRLEGMLEGLVVDVDDAKRAGGAGL